MAPSLFSLQRLHVEFSIVNLNQNNHTVMMYDYSDTLIGRDYLQKPRFYDTDLLLDFLGGLLTMRSKDTHSRRVIERYTREIDAVKHLLRMQSAMSRQTA